MTIPQFAASDFVPVMPALILTVGAILLLLSEVFLSTQTRTHQVVLALVASLAALGVSLSDALEGTQGLVFLGLGVRDSFSSFTTAVVCLSVALATLMAAGFLRHRNAERGEFYALMLFAAAGMSLLAMSNELVTLFVNLEVLSIATYALAAYFRRGTRPSEAAFKYFILGAFSSAVFLYGAALLYGATGTTRLPELAVALQNIPPESRALTFCALGLLGAGLAFKVAAVPFHMWTPDVYEGASTPVTALMSAGVKAAAFAALIRVFVAVRTPLTADALFGFLAVLCFLTMVVGNLLALPQRNVKRMLAYSSIAHAGYLLLGVTALIPTAPVAGEGAWAVFHSTPLLPQIPVPQLGSLKGILFYLLGYTVSAIGAFATLAALERREDEDKGTAWDLDRFAGLAQRRPGWAFAMAAFMLSLGGIPPTVGFMGKLLIFRSAVDAGMIGLCIVGVLSSAAGVYYYLRVVVYMFMRPSPEGATIPTPQWTTELAIAVSSLGVIALGMMPSFVSGWLERALLFGAK